MVTGPGKMSIAIVVMLTLVSILTGIISFTHQRPPRSDRTHCPVKVKKCADENHVYHLNASKCHDIGTSVNNLCGQKMAIYPVQNCPIQGECDCDYENNERHLVYHQETNQCYFIFSRGPCKPGFVVKIQGNRMSCQPAIKGESFSLVDKTDESYEAKERPSSFHPTTNSVSGHVPRRCYPGSYHAYRGLCLPKNVVEARLPSKLTVVELDE